MNCKMVHIGSGAYVPADKIRLIIPADSRKVKRILANKGINTGSGLYWNANGDMEIRTLIILDDGKLVSTFVTANAIVKRIEQKNNLEEQEDE